MFSLHFLDHSPYEIMSYDIKKAFTNCIPCMKSKVPTDSDEIEKKSGQHIKKSQENALMEKRNRRQRPMHTIPSSLIEVTKEDRRRLEHTLLLMALDEYNIG
jgi:hypothetical protein